MVKELLEGLVWVGGKLKAAGGWVAGTRAVRIATGTAAVAAGLAAVGGPVYYVGHRIYDAQQAAVAVNTLVSEGLAKDEAEAKKLKDVFIGAGGDPKDLVAAVQAFHSEGGKNEELEKWKKFSEKLVAWNGLSTWKKITTTLEKFFSDPKSFGAGSAVGAVGLGAVGAWLGGAWLAVPLALIGGLGGEAVLKAVSGHAPAGGAAAGAAAAAAAAAPVQDQQIEAPQGLPAPQQHNNPFLRPN